MEELTIEEMHFLANRDKWYINLPLERWEINIEIPNGIEISDVKDYDEDGNSDYHCVMVCDMNIVNEDQVDSFFKMLINKQDYDS